MLIFASLVIALVKLKHSFSCTFARNALILFIAKKRKTTARQKMGAPDGEDIVEWVKAL